MRKLNEVDFIGRKLGQLTILSKCEPSHTGHTCFMTKCDCGNYKKVVAYRLLNGTTQSCGCKKKLLDENRFKTHALSKHPLYSVWLNMNRRCDYEKGNRFYRYGGRGITVCDQWKKNFVAFYEWSVNNGWAVGLELDRRENSGIYEPSNCRYVTREVNANNKDYNRMYVVNGERLSLTQLSKKYGINKACLFARVNYGWTIERALSTPIRKQKKNISAIK